MFSGIASLFLNPTTGDFFFFYSRRPTLSDLQPKFAPRIFYQLAESFMKVKVVPFVI